MDTLPKQVIPEPGNISVLRCTIHLLILTVKYFVRKCSEIPFTKNIFVNNPCEVWHETNFRDKAEKRKIFENILLPKIHLYTLLGITVPKNFSLPHLLTVIILIMLGTGWYI